MYLGLVLGPLTILILKAIDVVLLSSLFVFMVEVNRILVTITELIYLGTNKPIRLLLLVKNIKP